MFVERSAAKIRAVRTLFVVACLLPTVGLVGWVWYRRSPIYADPLTAGWSRTLGLTVTADSLEHLRPNVIRLQEVAILDAATRPLTRLPEAELEQRADGVIARLPTVVLDAAAVAAAARFSVAWLTEPVRFPSGGVLQIDGLSWAAGSQQQPLGGFRIEYVIAEGGRAIRVRREPADADELRLRAVATSDGPRLEAELTCERGLPAELVAAATGWLPRLGPFATVRGNFRATAEEAQGGHATWSGDGEAVVVGVDLAGLAGVVGQRAQGEGVLRIEALTLEEGRITAARFLLSAEEGTLGRGLLERLVTVFDCRLGPAAGMVVADQEWLAGPPYPFDQADFAVDLTRAGMTLRSGGTARADLVTVAGQALLESAGGSISYERFAWLFAPYAKGMLPAAIPASEQAIEVLSHLPIASDAPQSRF